MISRRMRGSLATAGVVVAMALTACSAGGASGPPAGSPGSPGHWTAAQKSQFLAAAGSSGNAAQDACVAKAEEATFSFTDTMAIIKATPSSGLSSMAQLTAITVKLFGTAKGTQVANTLVAQANTCSAAAQAAAATPSATTAPAAAASPTSAPATTAAPTAPSSSAAASTTAPSVVATTPVATASSTVGTRIVWTQAQRQQLTDAYDSDPNLSGLSLACLQSTITSQVQAVYALAYVADIWVIPAPTRASVLPDLESRYGAQGLTIYYAWQVVSVAVDQC
jgi:hypothetical protein